MGHRPVLVASQGLSATSKGCHGTGFPDPHHCPSAPGPAPIHMRQAQLMVACGSAPRFSFLMWLGWAGVQAPWTRVHGGCPTCHPIGDRWGDSEGRGEGGGACQKKTTSGPGGTHGASMMVVHWTSCSATTVIIRFVYAGRRYDRVTSQEKADNETRPAF